MTSLTLAVDNNDNINTSPFDAIRGYRNDGSEFWTGRELMRLLGYSKWQTFGGKQDNRVTVVDRAMIACRNSGNKVEDNFTQVRNLSDWELSRYACYLIAMNGDPTKPTVSLAQTYFAIQTRKQEILVPQSYSQALLEAGRLAEINERLELEKQLLEEENLELAEAVDELFDYSSIIRIAKYNGVSETVFNWRVLKKFSKQLNLEVKQVPCPRFETKNLYAHAAWREAYPSTLLPETNIIRISQVGN